MLAGSSPPTGDWLLVNVTADYSSIAILRDEHLIFFRNRAVDTEGTLADLVHQTGMYYEDRLGGAGFSRVLLAGSAGGGLRQAAEVEQAVAELTARLEGGQESLTEKVIRPRKTDIEIVRVALLWLPVEK